MHKKKGGDPVVEMQRIRMLSDLLVNARRTVFFGGAGVSQESGIPDFRSQGGLYSQQWKYPPEMILSRGFFRRFPEEFYHFYREKMLFPAAQPNAAHRALARLEAMGRLSAVITQNIDGLHQAAGSRRVIELHGSVHRNFCMKCGQSFPLENILSSNDAVPRCPCGGIIKPDVVLYGENLDVNTLEETAAELAAADLLIIGGTSLQVYPAAAFAADFQGDVVIINRSETNLDGRAKLLIDAPIGAVMEALMGIFPE